MGYDSNFAICANNGIPMVTDQRDTGKIRIGPFRVNGKPKDLLEAIYVSDLKIGDGDQILDNMALGSSEYSADGVPGVSGLCINWLGGNTYEITAANMFVHGTLLSLDNLPVEDFHTFLKHLSKILIPGIPLNINGRRYAENRLISSMMKITLEILNRPAIKLENTKKLLDYETGINTIITNCVDIFNMDAPAPDVTLDNIIAFRPHLAKTA